MIKIKLLRRIKIKNLKINKFIVIVVFLVSCNNNELQLFKNNLDFVCFDVVKKTKVKPSIGHSYVLKKNGELYNFEYVIGKNKQLREANVKSFFEPKFWTLKKDSISLDIENSFGKCLFYKIIKQPNKCYLLIRKNDTIFLKQINHTFNINFYTQSRRNGAK